MTLINVVHVTIRASANHSRKPGRQKPARSLQNVNKNLFGPLSKTSSKLQLVANLHIGPIQSQLDKCVAKYCNEQCVLENGMRGLYLCLSIELKQLTICKFEKKFFYKKRISISLYNKYFILLKI